MVNGVVSWKVFVVGRQGPGMPQTGNGQEKLPGEPVEFYTIIKTTTTNSRKESGHTTDGGFIFWGGEMREA